MSGDEPTAAERAEWAQVRDLVVSEAARFDPIDYWPRLLEQRVTLVRSLEGVSEQQAAWRPPPPPEGSDGEEAWSIVEVAQHLLQWTENIIDVNHALAEGREAYKHPVGHLVPDPDASLDAVRRALIVASHRLADALLAAGAADPGNTVAHSRFGPLNVRQWLALGRRHDGGHLQQIEAIKQAPGYPSGTAGATGAAGR